MAKLLGFSAEKFTVGNVNMTKIAATFDTKVFIRRSDKEQSPILILSNGMRAFYLRGDGSDVLEFEMKSRLTSRSVKVVALILKDIRLEDVFGSSVSCDLSGSTSLIYLDSNSSKSSADAAVLSNDAKVFLSTENKSSDELKPISTKSLYSLAFDEYDKKSGDMEAIRKQKPFMLSEKYFVNDEKKMLSNDNMSKMAKIDEKQNIEHQKLKTLHQLLIDEGHFKELKKNKINEKKSKVHPSIGGVGNYTGTTRVEDQMSEDVLAAHNRVQISLNKFITRKRSELKSLN